MTESEQRRFQRLKACIPCSINWEGSILTGQVSNLSQGGALISQTEQTPPVGTSITLELRAGEQKIPFPAQVRAAEPRQPTASFGVEFLGSDAEIETRIIRLVDALFTALDGEPPAD